MLRDEREGSSQGLMSRGKGGGRFPGLMSGGRGTLPCDLSHDACDVPTILTE